ncbi:transmembrane protein, putative (macronuclear) [Tetrahymena thermophila SB210]|uniref:Transmembrane protein, putative n=1 Tax=Tetrahymena thermophila (strain SB210) TaxID=312017 RepID=Q22WG9_TETTS|nr:transmembrane protein, putative [Tetrahymena thermophila SB210]EAR89448.2 transmembrane protein, putative [Tetrahymena thermophila SB210]|eukprot:XP_001009693.2 transmembrane protein, putative [Tetrahymena thermophila SB210]
MSLPANKNDINISNSQQLPTSDTLQSSFNSQSDKSDLQTQSTNNLNNNTLSNMNTMNRFGTTSGYGGYGSSMYNSAYSSYGGFGGSYGGMYGSGMMGGYSTMGNGMMGQQNLQQQQQQQQQQPGFRDEYQGVLMGFNSMLNIMGAGVAMLGYGTTFVQIAKKALVFIYHGFSNLTYKILGIAYLKKLYNWITHAELEKQFTKTLHAAGKVEKLSLAKRVLGKVLFVVRILSGLALLGFYFAQYKLRQRMNQMKLEQGNLNNFDNELGPIIYDNQIAQDKENDAMIHINMNSEKAEIIDNLDSALNEELEEEEKECVLEFNNLQKENSTAEIVETKENVIKTDNLQEAFDDVINKEKNFIQQTQLRSEEFWNHKEPKAEITTETNFSNNSNAFILNINNNNNIVIPAAQTVENENSAQLQTVELNPPVLLQTASEIIPSNNSEILPNLASSVSSTSNISSLTSSNTVKKSVKPWMKNV